MPDTDPPRPDPAAKSPPQGSPPGAASDGPDPSAAQSPESEERLTEYRDALREAPKTPGPQV